MFFLCLKIDDNIKKIKELVSKSIIHRNANFVIKNGGFEFGY